MSLKPLRQLSKRTSFKLTVWFSAVFVFSALVLYVITYFLLSESMHSRDRQIAMAKIAEYTKIVQSKGLQSLVQALNSEHAENQQAGFFVRLSDSGNNVIFQTLPKGLSKIDPRAIEQSKITGDNRWVILQVERDHGQLEIRNIFLSEHILLQIGFGMRERTLLLEHFRKNFALIIIPILIFGIISGYTAANRALSPIRDLVQAIHRIGTGRLNERVTTRQSGDELDELVHLFNGMLAKIETLVNSMRESLANVAHDLKTPVTRLRVGVETTLQAEADENALREALLDCAEESERIVTILNTLMDISMAETGTMQLHLKDCNLSLLIQEAVELYQYVAEDKNIELHTEVPDYLPAQVDPNRIRQVLANLLDNAVKYTPENKSVFVEARRLEDQIVIRFKDEGIGIPPEDLPRIFERLFRGDRSRSERGLGLGLSLVKAVVDAHGGRVDVDSSTDRGSTFTLVLPTHPPAAMAILPA